MTRTSSIPLSAADARTLLRARQARGWTQRELADEAGCSHALISQIESGNRQPGYAVLAAICAALGLRLTVSIESPA